VRPRDPRVSIVILVRNEVRPEIEVVSQTRDGKGNALACGFAYATGDIIVMFDADGSADPAEIPIFVKALTAGADFAKGTRFTSDSGGDGGSDDITLWRRLGNAVLNLVSNMLMGTRFTDLWYGDNAFWRDMLEVIALPPVDPPAGVGRQWGDGFDVETLITAGLPGQLADHRGAELSNWTGCSARATCPPSATASGCAA
jgi:hypothetical protein